MNERAQTVVPSGYLQIREPGGSVPAIMLDHDLVRSALRDPVAQVRSEVYRTPRQSWVLGLAYGPFLLAVDLDGAPWRFVEDMLEKGGALIPPQTNLGSFVVFVPLSPAERVQGVFDLPPLV